MGLSREEHNVLEVRMVDMCIYAEQSFEDHFYDCCEILRERNTQLTREDLLVVQLVLDPSHKEVDVLTGAYFERCLNIVTISPEILVLGASRHGRA